MGLKKQMQPTHEYNFWNSPNILLCAAAAAAAADDDDDDDDDDIYYMAMTRIVVSMIMILTCISRVFPIKQ